ncbi:unnamed protein product [Litomosoides sigmodontis]|uniref:Uncharacterized protein n=1 Tax=Litomosoides sigmodontis TaxID=42156 RepID=A0A3P6SZF7_LITSI|nr:unnamed protein product [Litomosoides sigmodontis]
MGRKKSAKGSKAKHKQTGQKPPTGNEPPDAKASAPKSSDQKPVDPTTQPPEESAEERKQEVAEKFFNVLMSTMEMLNCNKKHSISAEVLMLIYIKSRWYRNPKEISPSWVKQYNKFGRIDGSGFNHMRRDFRLLYEQAEVHRKGFAKFIKKFPSEAEPKFDNVPVILKKMHTIARKKFFSKRSATIERFISKQNIELSQSTSKQNVSEDEGDSGGGADGGGDDGGSDDDDDEQREYEEIVDFLSEDESESFDLPPSLLIELRRECVKNSVAANIALEIICSPTTQMTLKRLLIFEKHQLVTEWEIAKEAYRVRNMNWKSAPGMVNLCDEIAAEMIEIDRTLEGIRCLAQYEMAAIVMILLKKFVKARLRRKRRAERRGETSATPYAATEEGEESEEGNETEESEESEKEDRMEESEKSEEGDGETEESEESEEQESEESEHTESTAARDSSDDIEELKSIPDEEDERKIAKIRKRLAISFIDLFKATDFFARIRNIEKKEEDHINHLNYQFYRMLSSMARTY